MPPPVPSSLSRASVRGADGGASLMSRCCRIGAVCHTGDTDRTGKGSGMHPVARCVLQEAGRTLGPRGRSSAVSPWK